LRLELPGGKVMTNRPEPAMLLRVKNASPVGRHTA